jgi:1-acyl-sn-glycerol-3-phosphate acyltransferase
MAKIGPVTETRLAESTGYRWIVTTSQYFSWLLAQLLRLRYSIRGYCPAGFFERDPGHCLILAANHKTYIDLGLIMVALGFLRFRALIPVRTLGTQDFRSPLLQSMKPLIKIAYRLEGVVMLPPEQHDERSLPEKLRGMLVALSEGEVAAIFPEGEVWRKSEPPIGEFAPGVIYLHRKSHAPVVPIAIRLSQQGWRRRHCDIQFGRPVVIPSNLDQDAGAAWLRDRVLELYDQAQQSGKE